MSKVIDTFIVANQTIIVFDEIKKDFEKVEINGKTYPASIVYDIKNAIAVSEEINILSENVILK